MPTPTAPTQVDPTVRNLSAAMDGAQRPPMGDVTNTLNTQQNGQTHGTQRFKFTTNNALRWASAASKAFTDTLNLDNGKSPDGKKPKLSAEAATGTDPKRQNKEHRKSNLFNRIYQMLV